MPFINYELSHSSSLIPQTHLPNQKSFSWSSPHLFASSIRICSNLFESTRLICSHHPFHRNSLKSIVLESEQLKLLPQASPHHNALAVSQQHLTNLSHLPLTPQLHPALRQQSLNASHASSQSAMVATSTHHTATGAASSISAPMGGLMMAARPTANTHHPLLLGNYYQFDYQNSLSANRDHEPSGNGTTPAGASAQAALLNQSHHLNENSQQALAAAAAAYLYPPPYDLSYAAQLSGLSGFIEYPMQSAMAAQVAVAAQEATSGEFDFSIYFSIYFTLLLNIFLAFGASWSWVSLAHFGLFPVSRPVTRKQANPAGYPPILTAIMKLLLLLYSSL